MLNTSEQIFNQIEKSKHPLIIFSADWRGDAVASALAFFLFLKKLKKEVEITANPSAKSLIWSFLPNQSEIINSLDGLRKFIISLNISQTEVGQIKYNIEDKKINFIVTPKKGWFKNEDLTSSDSGFKYDLIISFGASDLESLGQIYENNIELFYKTSIINLDCQPDNEEFGQINLININSTTISEIIFNLLNEKWPDSIDENIATCLLAGIISGTRNFRNTNLTPETLLITSKLISLGGRREEIVNKLYHSRNFKTLKLWGRVLNNLNTSQSGEIVWSIIKRADFKNSESLEDSLLDIIDELIINIPEAKLITIIFENPDNSRNKLLLYSIKNINALDILKEYSPSGNSKIAQAETDGDLEEISKKYLSILETKIKSISK